MFIMVAFAKMLLLLLTMEFNQDSRTKIKQNHDEFMSKQKC